MRLSILLALCLVLTGCARDNSQQIAMFKAYNQALVNCKGEVGCIVGTQAAMYSGMMNQQQDTITGMIVASLPWGRLILDGIAIYRGGSGGGGNGLIVNGSHNQFQGFNKLVADKGASLYAPFDATATPTLTQSWADLYNVGKNQN